MLEFDLSPLMGVDADVLAVEFKEAEQSLAGPESIRVEVLTRSLFLAQWPDVHRVYDLLAGTGYAFDALSDGPGWATRASGFAHQLEQFHAARSSGVH